MGCNGKCKHGPGMYPNLVTIEKPKTATDGATVNAAGHIDYSLDANWQEHTKAYAKIQTRGGREFFQASKNHAELSHLFEVPDSTKVRSSGPEMRINWSGRKFNILSVQDKDEARRYSEISTKEAV